MSAGPQPPPKLSRSSLFTALFFLLVGVYLRWIVDPRLVHHNLGILLPSIPFYYSTDWTFFAEHLTRAGGLVEYTARLLTQFYRFAWAGTAILASAALLLGWSADHLLRAAGRPQGRVLRYAPAVLILAMCGGYLHPLRCLLSLLLALSCFSLYLREASRRGPVRLVIVFALSVASYLAAGGASLLFPSLVFFNELLFLRNRMMALASLACLAAVPWAIGEGLFGLSAGEAYGGFLLDDPGMTNETRPLVAALFLFYPLLLIAAMLQQAAGASRASRKKKRPPAVKAENSEKAAWGLSPDRRQEALQFTLIALIAFAASWSALDRQMRAMLQADYYSQRELWTETLQSAGRMPYGVYNVRCNRNVILALYHTQRLGDEMFAYPQTPGADFIHTQEDQKLPYDFFQESRLLLELGQVNLAERCACEALEAMGELPAILEHLAMINIVKGRPNAARVFLNALRKQLFWRTKADRMLQKIQEDPQMQSDPRVRALRRSAVQKDDVSLDFDIEASLQASLERNPKNRLAFELLMAYYLCSARPDQVAANIDRLEEYGCQRIPTHYQEAIVVDSIVNQKQASAAGVSPEIVVAGDTLAGILALAQDEQEAVSMAVSQGLGDTYFFYFNFGVSGL